jgi:pyruvate dehydrogenase E2 component (dihydrolipoamide acetyltransferase)
VILTCGGDGAAPSEAPPAEEAAETPPAAPPPPEPGPSQGEPDVGVEPDPSRAGREAAEERVAPVPVPAATPPDADGAVYAGPAARRLARELDIDLTQVRGSGRAGRITREDVQAHAGRAPEPASAGAAAPQGLPPWPVVDFAAFGPVETRELTRIQRIAGPALARNWAMIPHVTQFDEADITDLEAFRKDVNARYADRGVKLTMVSLLLKACAAALRDFPDFNSSLDGDRLVIKRYHHLGFAADTPNGLMVPVIRDVDRKGLIEIAGELVELSTAAREGKLTREQMQGGTFTISSLGGIGGTAFTPIINAPEVAILGVSRSTTKPVWDGSQFVPRLMLPLSLSYDHRVIDGAAAARFTTHLAGLLADARMMLL